MGVQELSRNVQTSAILYGFDVNHSELRPEHVTWLDRSIIAPLAAEQRAAGQRSTSSSDAWQIWVVGTTSRTGSQEYNLALSNRRAEAVRRYLLQRLEKSTVVWSISISGKGELLAALSGRADDTEAVWDRSTYVTMMKVPELQPNPRLPPVPNKPDPTKSLELDGPGESHTSDYANGAIAVFATLAELNPVAGMANAIAAPWLAIGMPVFEAKEELSNRGLRAGYAVGMSAVIFNRDRYFVKNTLLLKGRVNSSYQYVASQAYNDGIVKGWNEAAKLPVATREAMKSDVVRHLDKGEAQRLEHLTWSRRIHIYARVFEKRFL